MYNTVVIDIVNYFRLKHEEGTSYTCQICSEVFARADYLKKHLQTHTGDNPKKNRTSTVPGKFLRFKNTGTGTRIVFF